MSKSEDVLLMVKHVRHKKVDGTLYVNSGRIAWSNQTSDTFRISANFEDIRQQRLSLDTKEKVQLQLLLHSNESFTFHFADPEGRTKQLEMRNKVKDLLQSLLPRFKDKAHSELNEKLRILKSNQHLLSLYKELVVPGILSTEEFWARPEFSAVKSVGSATGAAVDTRVETLPTQWVSQSGISVNLTHERSQMAGVPSCLLGDIKPETDGSNSIKYNLNKDTIDAIFCAYPAVRQRHKELVPDKLSEAEFWNKFFQSHYYHRDRAAISEDDVFSVCDVVDDKILKQELARCRKMRITGHLDVGELEDHTVGEGYGLEPPSPPPSAQGTSNSTTSKTAKSNVNTDRLLLRRFNKHSILIMRSLAKFSFNQAAAANAAAPSTPAESGYREQAYVGSLKNRIFHPDTEETPPEPPSNLELTATTYYFDNPAASTTTSSSYLNTNQARQALAACKASLSMPKRAGCLSFNNDDIQMAMVDVSAGGCLMTGGKAGSGGGDKSGTASSIMLLLSPEQCKELSMLYSTAGELLRHFWVCFPTTTIAMAEKVVRIHDSLGRFEATKLVPFIEGVESTLSNAGVNRGPETGGAGGGVNGGARCRVTAHLECLINTAKEKFRSWYNNQLTQEVTTRFNEGGGVGGGGGS